MTLHCGIEHNNNLNNGTKENDTQHNDTQHIGTLQNDTQYNNSQCSDISIAALRITFILHRAPNFCCYEDCH